VTEVEKLLDKAGRAIRAAERLMEDGLFEFAAGRAYYAMFYVGEAVLLSKGLRYAKHGGIHAAFGEHVVKPGEMDPRYHRWLLDAFDRRITAGLRCGRSDHLGGGGSDDRASQGVPPGWAVVPRGPRLTASVVFCDPVIYLDESEVGEPFRAVVAAHREVPYTGGRIRGSEGT